MHEIKMKMNAPHVPPAGINESDVAPASRDAQLLLEELEEDLAVALVGLGVDVIQTVLWSARQDQS